MTKQGSTLFFPAVSTCAHVSSLINVKLLRLFVRVCSSNSGKSGNCTYFSAPRCASLFLCTSHSEWITRALEGCSTRKDCADGFHRWKTLRHRHCVREHRMLPTRRTSPQVIAQSRRLQVQASPSGTELQAAPRISFCELEGPGIFCMRTGVFLRSYDMRGVSCFAFCFFEKQTPKPKA